MKIAVYITSYNQIAYLSEAINSVLDQTLTPHQIIVVDDASNDGSCDLIADYRNRYPELIVPILHKTNTGIAQVRIDALSAVKSDYVTYVDGDDRFLPEKLELESEVIRSGKDIKIAFSNNVYVTEDGKTRIKAWVDQEDVPIGDIFWHTFSRSFPKRSLFRMELVEYEALKRAGFHDSKLRLYEDYDLRIRLTKGNRAGYINRVLAEIRMHDHGLSKSSLASHLEALDYLIEKNRALLENLPAGEKKSAIRLAGQWINKVALRAGIQALKKMDMKQFSHACRIYGKYSFIS